jgi:hypothetical protein
VVFGEHADQEMKMVVHEAESKNFSEIDAGKVENQVLQVVLVGWVKGESGQGSAGMTW